MKVQSLFRDAFSGRTTDAFSASTGISRLIINAVALAGILLLAFFTIKNTVTGANAAAVLDAVALGLLVASLLLQRIRPVSDIPSVLGILAIATLYFYLFLAAGAGHFGYLWFYTLPPICLVLLGPSGGSIMFLSLYGVVILVTFGAFPSLVQDLGPGFVSRFLITLLLTFVLSVSFEVARRRAYQLLERRNNEQGTTLSEVQQLSVELKESEALHRTLIERANDGIVLLTGQEIRLANEKMARMLGYKSDELVGRKYADFVDPSQRGRLAEIYRLRLAGEPAPELYETMLLHRDGFRIPVEVSAGMIHFDRSPADFVVVRDISSRKKFEDELRYHAYHDSLTRLGNRKALYERLQSIIDAPNSSRVAFNAIFYLDLDGFKTVNDTFGHAAGDHVLQAVSRRLQEQVRSTDDVFRIGGDEFVIVATSLSRDEDAAAIAMKLVHAISRPYPYDGKRCSVTTSVGICTFYPASADTEVLLHRADEAMFAAKREKNTYHFAEHATGQ